MSPSSLPPPDIQASNSLLPQSWTNMAGTLALHDFSWAYDHSEGQFAEATDERDQHLDDALAASPDLALPASPAAHTSPFLKSPAAQAIPLLNKESPTYSLLPSSTPRASSIPRARKAPIITTQMNPLWMRDVGERQSMALSPKPKGAMVKEHQRQFFLVLWLKDDTAPSIRLVQNPPTWPVWSVSQDSATVEAIGGEAQPVKLYHFKPCLWVETQLSHKHQLSNDSYIFLCQVSVSRCLDIDELLARQRGNSSSPNIRTNMVYE
ncbi:hypothetical protein C8J56DRAFT_902711 [Mycena floridula]|nr:hypothetical protein C8J56DRAFT_902711 [Mycena floridula]